MFHSRESWAEVNDTVPDLVSHKKKQPRIDALSDADSAIGMVCDYYYPSQIITVSYSVIMLIYSVVVVVVVVVVCV